MLYASGIFHCNCSFFILSVCQHCQQTCLFRTQVSQTAVVLWRALSRTCHGSRTQGTGEGGWLRLASPAGTSSTSMMGCPQGDSTCLPRSSPSLGTAVCRALRHILAVLLNLLLVVQEEGWVSSPSPRRMREVSH